MVTQFLARNAILTNILMGVVGLSLMSQITIPLKPVSITLQTVAVLFIGLTYSRRDALLTMLSYLTIGAMGFPVFANFTGGVHHLLSPVGGFYIGFMIAAVVMASVRARIETDSIVSDISLSILGSVVLYTLGVVWLSNFIGLVPAIMGGVVPFILPGILKSIILAGILKYVR